MGYEVNRFVGEVDEELLCTICGQVLQEPVQIQHCEHCFCKCCINEWLNHQQICPVDRNPVIREELIPAPRILRNLLSRLRIACDNAEFGCAAVVKLDALASHMDECQYNPKRPVACDKGCGMVVPLDEVAQHNCIQELHKMLKKESKKVHEITERQQKLEHKNRQLEAEITMLKEIVHSLRRNAGCLPPAIGYPDEVERGIHTAGWLTTLRPARVRRWGGMISTPDGILQSIIRRALDDSGCPAYLLDDLMMNAHERQWPPGLSTLETRQTNRRRYEQYVTKRVPSKQAIIIMASENEHMGENMIVSPGMVMIFAHGVE